MDTTKLAVICRMFLIEVESCSKFCVRGTIKLISLVTGAMLLEDRDAGIITIGAFLSAFVIFLREEEPMCISLRHTYHDVSIAKVRRCLSCKSRNEGEAKLLKSLILVREQRRHV